MTASRTPGRTDVGRSGRKRRRPCTLALAQQLLLHVVHDHQLTTDQITLLTTKMDPLTATLWAVAMMLPAGFPYELDPDSLAEKLLKLRRPVATA